MKINPKIEISEKPSGTKEAEVKFGKIFIYPKFFTYGKEMQTWILAHELGHVFREELIPLADIVGWADGENFLIYGQRNSDEGFAESFAAYLFDPHDFKQKYPEQFAKMKSYVTSPAEYKNWVIENLPKATAKHTNNGMLTLVEALHRVLALDTSKLDYLNCLPNYPTDWHFEEGGCWGMAAALYEHLKNKGFSPKIKINTKGFNHAWVELDGYSIDHMGLEKKILPGDFIAPADIKDLADSAVGTNKFEGDKQWASELILASISDWKTSFCQEK